MIGYIIIGIFITLFTWIICEAINAPEVDDYGNIIKKNKKK